MPEDTSNTAIVTLLNSVLQQQQAQNTTVALIQRDLLELKNQVTASNKILREGNGQPSLLTRAALTEEALKNSTASIQELKKTLEARELESEKGKWQLITSIVAAMLGLISAAIAAYIGLHKGP